MAEIDSLFDVLLSMKGSDLHLSQGHPPKMRVNGSLTPIPDGSPLTAEALSRLMQEIAPPAHWARFQGTGDLDFAYNYGSNARFRANYLKHLHGIAAVFRIIPSRILTLDELNCPPVFKTFAHLRSGLVLVTGPTGSGKSTTLAAIIDHLNRTARRKIITIEEPVEFVHQNQLSLVIQREVGIDTQTFSSGLKGAVKSDANAILVGEMRDRETMELALSAVEMGILVFGTLHTNSAAKTIDRIIDTFPATQKGQIRAILANALQAVISQQLIKSSDGSRRHAAHEILMYSSALPAIIRAGDITKLTSVMQSNRQAGMITMDDSLAALVEAGKITRQQAHLKAFDKTAFE